MKLIRKTPFKNRLGLFDFYKGTLMILIVVFHHGNLWMAEVKDVNPSFIILKASVVMASFFMISGYGFKATDSKSCFHKQVKQMLEPYFWMMLACVLIVSLKNILKGRAVFAEARDYALGFLLVHTDGSVPVYQGIQPSTTGWFLVTLFLSWNLLNLLFHIKKEKLRHLAVAAVALLGMCLTLIPVWIWCLPQSLLATALLYAGYLIKEKKVFYHKIPKKFLLGLFLLWGVSLIFGAANMAANTWKLGMLDFLGAIAGGILLLKGYTYIEFPDVKATEIVMKIGRYTYWIMCLHGVSIGALKFETYIRRLQLAALPSLLLHIMADSIFIIIGCILLQYIAGIKHKYQRRKK